MIEVSESERREVLSRCVEFLGKVWKEVKDDEIECLRMSSGVANKTYHVSIKGLEKEGLRNNVIVRIYNSGLFERPNTIKFNGEPAEVIVHQRLSEIGMASKIFGVFDGGRIEEYIPSRASTVEDLNSIELSKKVIRKIALFHTQSMPVSKTPNFMEKVSSVVRRTVIPLNFVQRYPNEVEECNLILNFPLEEEFAWIAQILPIVGYKVVFSHNDLNPNNILLKDKPKNDDDKILLIDYEMSGYFYRAYDLAYFLRLKRCHIKLESNKISISYDAEDDSAVNVLLNEYLDQFTKLRKGNFDSKYDNLQRLRMEVEFFDLVCDIFTIGMTKTIAAESRIPFPVAFGAKPAKEYKEKKERVIGKYGDPTNWNKM